MLANDILEFHRSLRPIKVPGGINVLNPYRDTATLKLVQVFYRKYYSDHNPRTLLLGINPGRFGAGITGISFTDPIRLETECGIPNDLAKKAELSSDFIYRMITAYGGVKKFYSRYLISAVSPLGFTRGGKNINYYDDKKLESVVRPFAKNCIDKMLMMNIDRTRCFCIGEGKNYKFLVGLNKGNGWFKEIIPLPHPRFIMQYRRKQLAKYIRLYVDQLA